MVRREFHGILFQHLGNRFRHTPAEGFVTSLVVR